ncbi:amino acid transporter [Neohortaea acidophila]|uniref:Amino acid transporter n=1 Tax=Neohortaea acidophila TaxID=245834 RepID=A0A6A6PIW3_9PEZI|nr:amino acid transporter [Neohortaea acidophila]KAF2479980.1 amino acid transporter [Neohortaea acidophila]
MAGDVHEHSDAANKEVEPTEAERLLNEQGGEEDNASQNSDTPSTANGGQDLAKTGQDAKRPRASPRRQSSFAQHRPGGTPRTQNRVRFDVIEPPSAMGQEWLDEEDYVEGGGQHAPLLTSIEAPSVTLANDIDLDPAEYLESARPKSGLRSAFMNMANSIIGAGIIGQPYAFKQAGLFTGILLLISLTVIVDWTIRLIVTNSKLSGADSFQATVQKCFGKPGLIAISVAQWAFAFGGMVAFCVIIGDTIPRVIASAFPSLYDKPVLWLLTDRRAIIVVFVMCISYPLSLYRDIAMLAKASTLALISMLIILITIVTQGPIQSPNLRGPLQGSLLINNGVFQAIGVISFAFVCHHNSLLIYGSLKTPTMDRFAKVTHYSTGISMLACMTMALAGYLSFGSLTEGNVLNNFPTDNVLVNIARLCFGLNMLTTLPLECFVCREVMNQYFHPNQPHNTKRHLIFTTGLVISAMSVSLITCDLGVVFELVGATSACALAYILPPLCFVKLTSRRTWETYAAYACIAFGCVVMGISLTLSVIKMVKGGGEGGSCR